MIAQTMCVITDVQMPGLNGLELQEALQSQGRHIPVILMTVDAGMPFLRPISDRYFEDYVEGDVHRFGTIAVGADEIVAFAKQFDPQTLHTDPEAAKSGPFGGLIASGWHTAGLMTRLFMDHYLTKVASLGSPGGDELRWVKPVRPGDNLSVRVTVLKAVPSKSKPDRGAVTSFVEVINQASEVVMTFKVVNIIARRLPGS
jgi:acyl dehydratase